MGTEQSGHGHLTCDPNMTSLHHSWLALEPSLALASFSLSLLMQVHEAAAVVESGGDAGIEWRPAAASTRAAEGR